MTSLERCKHCGREIWPSGDGRYFHEVEYAGARYCKAGTVAEPKPTEAQRDIELLKNIEYRGDPGTTQGAVERLIAKIAEKLGLV